MPKKDKLLERLKNKPPPLDFRWDDLVTLMTRAGFGYECTGGSHYTFEHSSGFRFFMSKTHPGGILKRYQIRDAIDALAAVEVTEGKQK